MAKTNKPTQPHWVQKLRQLRTVVYVDNGKEVHPMTLGEFEIRKRFRKSEIVTKEAYEKSKIAKHR